MTSYRYQVTLTDGDVVTIARAFELLEAHTKTLNGEAPAWHDTKTMAEIRQKIRDGAWQVSGNNFFDMAPPQLDLPDDC